MKLIPNTLFSRAVVVMITMILLSIIAGFILFIVYFTRPMAVTTADLFALHMNSVHQALLQLPPEERSSYIKKLQDNGMLFVIEDENAKPGRAVERFYEEIFMEHYPDRLFEKNPEVRFEFESVFYSEGKRTVWVKVNLGDRKVWLGTPMTTFKPSSNNAIIQLAVMLLLALLGSYMISRVVKRPMKQLIRAANDLGQGNSPEPIEEAGTHEFRTMSKAFNKMSKDIEALNEDRNLMLAGISHDLRTPLTRLRLALDMLENKIDTEMREGMIQDIEDMDKIVGQFLTFVRDGVDEPYAYEDVNRIIEHVANGFRLEGKEIKLKLNGIESSMFKPIAIQRLCMNLINNAWHYGRQDVEVETKMIKDAICIEFKDCGDGIPEDQIERLLQPFTRLESSRTDSKGAGLGLAIVDRIVKWHHGRLNMRSRDGGGLIVSVYLPVSLQQD